jgi:hypothetical protein
VPDTVPEYAFPDDGVSELPKILELTLTSSSWTGHVEVVVLVLPDDSCWYKPTASGSASVEGS